MDVIQAFRPVSMNDWFMLDPVLNRVTNNNATADGIKAEIAEAVRTPEGFVVWRVSGNAQKAEIAAELECGRMQNTTNVDVGTLKVSEFRTSSNVHCIKKLIIRIQIELSR